MLFISFIISKIIFVCAQKNELLANNNRSSHAINLRTQASSRHSLPLITVPPFKPIHPGDYKLNRPNRITKLKEDDGAAVTVVAVPAFAALPQSIAKVPTYTNKIDAHALQNLLHSSNNRRISVSSSLVFRYF